MSKSLLVSLVLIVAFVLIRTCDLMAAEPVFEYEQGPSWHKNIPLDDGYKIVAHPAKYQIIEITRIVEDAKVVERQIPAVTKEVKRRVVKTPAKLVEKVIPAVKRMVTTRVIDKPARTTTRVIPAVTKKISVFDFKFGKKSKKEIVIQPEHEEIISIPATFKTVKQEVVVQEEQIEQVWIPAEFTTVTETVLVSEARTEKRVIPAVTESVIRREKIKPALLVLEAENGDYKHIFTSESELKRFLDNPSDPSFAFNTDVFQVVDETIVTSPSRTEYQTIPAVEETIVEHIVVQEASTQLVEVPASYQTVTETVVIQPATTEIVNVPARFKTIKETIVVAPARNGKPAETKTVEVKRLVSPAKAIERTIPAKTQQVTRRVNSQPPRITERVIPALTKQESRRVVRTPAQVLSKEVQAESVTITRFEMKQEQPTSVEQSPPGSSSNLIQTKFVWPASNTLPMFLPPLTDIKIDIPNSTCGYTSNRQSPSLMQVFNNFSALLNQYQYQKRVFKYQHGFAILTMPERIAEDATNIMDPALNRRIELDQHPIDGIASYLQILFTKPVTRYRYLAFIVTADDNVESADEQATPEGLQAVFKEGGVDSDLPKTMNDYAFTDDYKCQVWVYEFARIDREDPVSIEGESFVPSSPTLGEFAHKAGSPVLKALFNATPR